MEQSRVQDGPGPLFGHTLLQHPWRPDSLIIYGGRDRYTQPSRETWVLDLKGNMQIGEEREVGVRWQKGVLGMKPHCQKIHA